MNDEAEAWIAELISETDPVSLRRVEMLRAAMRWAYADAAKVCRDSIDSAPFETHNWTGIVDETKAICAEAIEARARGN